MHPIVLGVVADVWYGERMPPSVKNLMDSPAGETETFRTLLDLPGMRVEQIVPNGQTSAEGFWYDQKEPEWVMLVRGEAVLRFEPGGDVSLKSGDFLLIPANARQRVESVSADAVWLALHFQPEASHRGRPPAGHFQVKSH